MIKLMAIGIGGAIGTLLRYSISGLDYKFSNGIFPFSTLLVNLMGSFAIGILWGAFEDSAVPPTIRTFMFIGLLGGFTTFSTFALENFNLIKDGERIIAVMNILISNLFGVGLVFIGYGMAKLILSFFK